MSAKKVFGWLPRGSRDILETRDELPHVPSHLENLLQGSQDGLPSLTNTNTEVAVFRETVGEFFEEEDLCSPASEDAGSIAVTRDDLVGLRDSQSKLETRLGSVTKQLATEELVTEELEKERLRLRLEGLEDATEVRVVSSNGTVIWAAGQIPPAYESAASSLVKTSLLLSQMSREQESSVCARFRGVTIKAVGFAGTWSVVGSTIFDDEEDHFLEKARHVYKALLGEVED